MTEQFYPGPDRQASVDTTSPDTEASEVEATADKSPGLGVTRKFPSLDVEADVEPEQEDHA